MHAGGRHAEDDERGWAKRVERWKDSGLTAAEYAAETGLNAHSLSWWKWKLGASPSSTSPARRASKTPRASRTAPVTPLTFVEVSVPPQSQHLEVVLAKGRTVRVPVGFDAPTFERLLAILERTA